MIFQNPTLVKSKDENHRKSMCNSSKEPYGFTDYKSEEKKKKMLIFDWFVGKKKTCFKKTRYFHWKKEFFCYSFSQISVFFQILFRFVISKSMRFIWAITHWILVILICSLYKGGMLKNQNSKSEPKNWQSNFCSAKT